MLRKLFKLNPGVHNAVNVGKDVGDQAVASACHVYDLVKPPGNDRGLLVDAMAEAMNTKQYGKLRDMIREQLDGYLYTEEECHIPIKILVENRHQERRTKTKEKQRFVYTDQATRECCWKIDKRGAVGETIIHLCCLNNQTVHSALMREVITIYPNLLKDIYLADEYYGETPLHMAIANEDTEMIKFILEQGKKINLDLNARCCGNFFCPEDQKSTRHDYPTKEVVGVSEITNYKGYMYWGEYLLCFAAYLQQEEAFKLLLEYGANITNLDSNGNNVLHLMVIHNNKNMFNLAYRSAATEQIKRELLETQNRQGYTPLTLAAKQANKEMFSHILDMKRKIAWSYGEVLCAEYPLKDLDTINTEDGSINRHSALSIVLSEETETHLDMLDGLMYQILHDKWKAYAKVHFYKRMFVFALYLIAFIAAIYMQPPPDPNNDCYLLNITKTSPTAALDISRTILEILICISAFTFLMVDVVRELYMQGIHPFWWSISNAPTRAMFLISCCFILMTIPCRLTCSIAVENWFLTLCICLTIPHCLFFFRGFKLLGPFIVMIYHMVMGDLLRFLLIYFIFLFGFSQAMFVVNRGSTTFHFENPIESLLTMFSVMLGEFQEMYASFDNIQQPSTAKLLFLFYIVFVTILLLNMLIAMMGNTFKRIEESKREWQRQWAKIVLVMEQSISKRRRKVKQLLYSQPIDENSKDRSILVRTRVKVKDTRTKSVKTIVNKLQFNLIQKQKDSSILDDSNDVDIEYESNIL